MRRTEGLGSKFGPIGQQPRRPWESRNWWIFDGPRLPRIAVARTPRRQRNHGAGGGSRDNQGATADLTASRPGLSPLCSNRMQEMVSQSKRCPVSQTPLRARANEALRGPSLAAHPQLRSSPLPFPVVHSTYSSVCLVVVRAVLALSFFFCHFLASVVALALLPLSFPPSSLYISGRPPFPSDLLNSSLFWSRLTQWLPGTSLGRPYPKPLSRRLTHSSSRCAPGPASPIHRRAHLAIYLHGHRLASRNRVEIPVAAPRRPFLLANCFFFAPGRTLAAHRP